MSVQGLDVKMATSSGAQGGGVDTPPGRIGVAEKPSLYRQQQHIL